MWLPTVNVASALLRTSTEGDGRIWTSVTSSSALRTAAALRPRKVQPRPPPPPDRAGSTLPARVLQVVRPAALGRPASVTARSQYQLTPYWRSPVRVTRSEEHTSELQSLMRTSYAVFCLKKKI